MRSPIDLKEPWLVGYGLNYYAYWYRFGHFLGTILNLTPSDIYNQLQALTYSLYIAAIFRLTTRFLGWSAIAALFTSLIIAFGSNLNGVFNFLMHEDNWWGPSRVIAGAINEFPVWSFLLGDLHPHYLNLSMIPLLLILFLHLIEASTPLRTLFSGLIFLICGALIIYNANAWEVPIWGLVIGALLFERLLVFAQAKVPIKFSISKDYLSLCLIGVTVILLSLSLYLSSKNIMPNPYQISMVKDSVKGTTLLEFFQHWGIPTAALIVTFLTAPIPLMTPIAIGFIALATLWSGDAYPLLWGFLLLAIGKVVHNIFVERNPAIHRANFAYILSGIGIILCLIPEYIFLDDPYGGENERMNTIFKIYSSNWFIFHLGAIGVAREAIKKWNFDAAINYTLMGSVLFLSLAFFAHTVKLRKTPDRGAMARLGALADVEEDFPGGAEAILFLRTQPGKVVLEAQGNPYSWTSFVSTLADKDSFLGWANHVELLVRAYPEINRRKQVTEDFYTKMSCAERQQTLVREKIDYVVVGSLERKQYPMIADLGCMKEIFSNQEYKIYSN